MNEIYLFQCMYICESLEIVCPSLGNALVRGVADPAVSVRLQLEARPPAPQCCMEVTLNRDYRYRQNVCRKRYYIRKSTTNGINVSSPA